MPKGSKGWSERVPTPAFGGGREGCGRARTARGVMQQKDHAQGKLREMRHVSQQDNRAVPVRTAERAGQRGHRSPGTTAAGAPPAGQRGSGASSPPTCKALIYLDWNNLSVAVILTTSALRSQSGAALIEAFMSSHKSSKMKTQGPLKYTPRVCAVQLEAFMTPVRAFMTL